MTPSARVGQGPGPAGALDAAVVADVAGAAEGADVAEVDAGDGLGAAAGAEDELQAGTSTPTQPSATPASSVRTTRAA